MYITKYTKHKCSKCRAIDRTETVHRKTHEGSCLFKQTIMIQIDLNRIRQRLPNRAEVTLIKYKGKSPALICKVSPPLSEEDFEMCKEWQREIIGKENISEFYTEETGHFWYVFLKRIPMELEGVSDNDINSFTGEECVKNGTLINQK